MSTRIFDSLALVVLLGACGERAAPSDAPAKAGVAIACALAGTADFTSSCAVEQIKGAQGLQLVVRHPDGAFRRFDVLTDGHGLATADGAQAAQIALREGGIEVTVGR